MTPERLEWARRSLEFNPAPRAHEIACDLLAEVSRLRAELDGVRADREALLDLIDALRDDVRKWRERAYAAGYEDPS